MNVRRLLLVSLGYMAVGVCTLGAQESVFPTTRPMMAAAGAVEATAKPVAAPIEPLTARWLDLTTLAYSSRYRDTKNWHGRTLFGFGQERYVAEGRLKLDAAGRLCRVLWE